MLPLATAAVEGRQCNPSAKSTNWISALLRFFVGAKARQEIRLNDGARDFFISVNVDVHAAVRLFDLHTLAAGKWQAQFDEISGGG